ncbi:MAG: hypothetical protein PVG65_06125 [Candidatus Thorarchaeota archaeon]|jgi:hypothetical protein
MTSRKSWLVLCATSIFLLSITPALVNADIAGNTYHFSAIFYRTTVQANDNPEYVSEIEGQFSIHVYNISQEGGDDVINYNYQGFSWTYDTASYVDFNGSVDFQDQKVYWELNAPDMDGNNRSEQAGIIVYPTGHVHHPGQSFFVNPYWSTHETNWNTAIEDTENFTSATLVSQSMSDGTFEFEIEIDMEYPSSNMNGTNTYTFSATYDEDGILSSYELATR